MGPVTLQEYLSRMERYDEQLKEIGNEVIGKSTEEKIKILRNYRVEQYIKLQDAVYKERGWNKNGCPTLKKVKELGLDFKDILNIITPYQ
jgi:aldehyde:ferredoxin oxidoreductase